MRILITRDRLKETDSFHALKAMVRYALHYYANERAKIKIKNKTSEQTVFNRDYQSKKDWERVLKKYKNKIDENAYQGLKYDISEIAKKSEKSKEKRKGQLTLLGSFATAGINTLQYHHQVKDQMKNIR